MNYKIWRQDGAVWADAWSESANASLWTSGTPTARIVLGCGTGSKVELWEHGPGCVDRIIDRAGRVASALGLPAPSADEWAAIFVELQRLLGEALGEAHVPDKTDDLIRYSWALHSTIYADDDPDVERGHVEPAEGRAS